MNLCPLFKVMQLQVTGWDSDPDSWTVDPLIFSLLPHLFIRSLASIYCVVSPRQAPSQSSRVAVTESAKCTNGRVAGADVTALGTFFENYRESHKCRGRIVGVDSPLFFQIMEWSLSA